MPWVAGGGLRWLAKRHTTSLRGVPKVAGTMELGHVLGNPLIRRIDSRLSFARRRVFYEALPVVGDVAAIRLLFSNPLRRFDEPRMADTFH